ncbi:MULTISPECIES: hypothetical protein [Burkholderia]|uniref:Uncharacterized protein n=2 Tax=Burkholderia cepacia complex TaxID=87882 RepID=A0AAP1YBD0_9BURK|nr:MULTISPECIES: hypothetical protein [Burkholderia]MBK1902248.1 hypothetical protein [Burkholderia contaminans]MBK1910531.1 hypothetical protein [Burkholderia contaminans]MBK1923990.1 hypothetical protein [Burkholderia contaminans]MBK1932202.1 hypothetical protein [Burkholderia contaminans]MBK1939451.1 hypothetical protein [Burkholderia contaminans]
MPFDMNTHPSDAVSLDSFDSRTPEPAGRTSAARFDAGPGGRPEAKADGELAHCEATLRQLGYVNIFSFAIGEFLIVARNGERVRGSSLGDALQEMSNRLGLKVR